VRSDPLTLSKTWEETVEVVKDIVIKARINIVATCSHEYIFATFPRI